MHHSFAIKGAVLAGLFMTSVLTGVAVAGVDIRIDTSSQLMTVAVEGDQQYIWKVSTGKPGHATPSGKFRPFRLERRHRSDELDGAPMPHSIFFTDRGHAIHGSPYTRHLGTPASHGCVRLTRRNARTLFSLVEEHGLGKTKITIADGGIDSEIPQEPDDVQSSFSPNPNSPRQRRRD
jgi:lipoprotein-anchoring transpeptidase ErfK/SrfK